MSWLERAWLEPPGYWLNGVAGLLGLLTIASASGPGGYFGFAMLMFIAWLFFGAFWLLRLIGASGIAYARKQLKSPAERTIRRWFAAPLIAAVSIVLSLSSWPEWIAFRLSLPAMDRLAIKAASDPASVQRSGWVGVYPAARIEAVPGGVRFIVQGTGFLSSGGFAYFENGVSPADRGIYRPIGGSWFRWTEPFLD